MNEVKLMMAGSSRTLLLTPFISFLGLPNEVHKLGALKQQKFIC